MSNTHPGVPGVPTVPSLCFAAAFGLFTTAGLAAEPTDIEKALLKRIDMLEQRLSDMQKALDETRSEQAAARAKPAVPGDPVADRQGHFRSQRHHQFRQIRNGDGFK